MADEQKIVTEEKTLGQLKEEAVALGMPKDDVEKFTLKAPLQATINALKTSTAETKRVATLNDDDPDENKKINKVWLTKAEKMRAKLESQPKVRMILPLSSKEKPGVVREVTIKGRKELVHVSGAIETVQLCGYKYIIPKGVYIEVPLQISEVLSESMIQTQNAGLDIRTDRAGFDDKPLD